MKKSIKLIKTVLIIGAVIIASVCICCIAVSAAIENNPVSQNALQGENTFYISDEDADYDFAASAVTQLVSAEQFVTGAKLIPYGNGTNASVLYSDNISVSPNDLLILKFTAYTDSEYGKININVNSSEISANYPVYTQKADYYIPITSVSAIETVSVTLTSTYQQMYITDFQIANFESTSISELKSGIYMRETTESIFTKSDSFGNTSKASTADDNFLYSVISGTLTVYDISDGKSPLKISSLDGIGTCHDIALLKGGKSLIVTSREHGAYFVDVSDPYNPKIASSYATLEMATGLAVCGDYVFICSRYLGLEIIDACDIYNPKYYAQISNNEEMYDCYVSDGYLYIGIWGQRKIQIYSLSDLRNPSFISTVLLDGSVGGIMVRDGILYAATGYHSRDKSTNRNCVGFGMGNGFEIYDVSDPSNPLWLSTSKIDGRYKYSGNDYWKLKVSGNYVAVANTFCGVYVYDISNPKSPQRIDHITSRINKDESGYVSVTSSNYLFNFDNSEYWQGALESICTSRNRLFFGGANANLCEKSYVGMESETILNESLSGSERISVTVTETGGYSASYYLTDSSVYSLERANGLIYAATSTGIEILNEELNLLKKYKTDYPVKDIRISSDSKYLYTAECDAGVGIYEINGYELSKISIAKDIKKYNFTATSIELSADENFLLCQTGFTRISTVDVTDKTNPVMVSSVSSSTMYYRNICQGVIANKYNMYSDAGKITFYGNESGKLEKSLVLSNSLSAESNGMAAFGDNVIAIYKNGYVCFNPNTDSSSLSSLTVHKIPGVSVLKGKPVIYGNIMAVSYFGDGTVTIIDIEDIDNPKLILKFKIDGCVDVADISENFILIPLRNDGILKLSPNSENLNIKHRVTGIITDNIGTPINGASLTVSGNAVSVTDENGEFSFFAQAGDYELTVSANNSLSRTIHLTVSPSDTENDFRNIPVKIINCDFVNDSIINAKDYSFITKNLSGDIAEEKRAEFKNSINNTVKNYESLKLGN